MSDTANCEAQTTIKKRPILFSGSMVCSILEGRKTQTRRVVKQQPQPPGVLTRGDGNWRVLGRDGMTRVFGWEHDCPYGKPGDRLWVRETWASSYQDGGWGTAFRADMVFVLGKRRHENGPHFHGKELGDHVRWRPSIFMPRWASRITLEIVEVRVQRLQEISEEDAIAEGLERQESNAAWASFTYRDYGMARNDPFEWFASPIDSYQSLWDSINGKNRPWVSNPWV